MICVTRINGKRIETRSGRAAAHVAVVDLAFSKAAVEMAFYHAANGRIGLLAAENGIYFWVYEESKDNA